MINFMTRFGKLVTARTVVTMTAMTRKTMTKNEKEALVQATSASKQEVLRLKSQLSTREVEVRNKALVMLPIARHRKSWTKCLASSKTVSLRRTDTLPTCDLMP